MVTARTKVLLEQGKSKVFAVALDWPGWARVGKGEQAALEALDAYTARYAAVAERADLALPERLTYSVAERVAGSGATDFGIPYEVAEADRRRWTGAEAERQLAIMRAAWDLLDEVVAGAPPTLKKGPRGGGRDRDRVLEHVLRAEASYARSFGVRPNPPAFGDHAAVRELRDEITDVLGRPSSGGAIGGSKGWPARYAVRRITWHVLDHAWEIQDKS